MNYQETLQYINNTPKFSKILGNDDLLKLLESLGSPQDSLSFIHIAGTNGKGSVSAMTASILKNAGYKVGLFTSPFIEEFNERIKINGDNIPDGDLSKIATIVKERCEELSLEISVFAQITAMAFLYFEREKCDIVVLEAGLGGRLDATNVIKNPKATVITKIGFDHTEWLGDTLEKIATEKCGIIKDGAPLFTCENQADEVITIIKNFAKSKNSQVTFCKKTDYPLSLLGEYQKQNAGIAVEVCRHLGIGEETIKKGLLSTKWPARFEFLKENLIIDGGHNPDGITALLDSLKNLGRKVIFVTAMMEDKEISTATGFLDEFSDSIIATEIAMPRCLSAEKLADHFTNAIICKNPIDAVYLALSKCEANTVVCVCGSLYLAGEVRKHFK